jgi:hypothetical protein
MTTERVDTPIETALLNSYVDLNPGLQFIHSHTMDDEQGEKRFFSFRGEEFDIELFENTNEQDAFIYTMPSPSVWHGEYDVVYATLTNDGHVNVKAGYGNTSAQEIV